MRLSLLALLLFTAFVGLAQDESSDCTIDLTPIRELLDTAQAELEAGNENAALVQMALAEADLEAILTTCTDKDVAGDAITPETFALDDTLAFTEEIVLRRALPDGNLLMRYPESWYAEASDEQVRFADERAALTTPEIIPGAQAGALTVFTPSMLSELGLDAETSLLDITEALAARFADDLDETMLNDAEAFVAGNNNAAIITGTASEDGQTMYVAFVVVDLDVGFAFIFLATDDAASPYADTIQTLAAELIYIEEEE